MHVKREMVMVRKLILGTASVLALAIGGAALDFSADAGDVANGLGKTASMPHHWIDAANLSKDDVRWAQLELRNIGLYNGSLDGVIGTKSRENAPASTVTVTVEVLSLETSSFAAAAARQIEQLKAAGFRLHHRKGNTHHSVKDGR